MIGKVDSATLRDMAASLGDTPPDTRVVQAMAQELLELRATTTPLARILLSHLDAWGEHVHACNMDDCDVCCAAFNLVVKAHAVWSNSQHGHLRQEARS